MLTLRRRRYKRIFIVGTNSISTQNPGNFEETNAVSEGLMAIASDGLSGHMALSFWASCRALKWPMSSSLLFERVSQSSLQ